MSWQIFRKILIVFNSMNSIICLMIYAIGGGIPALSSIVFYFVACLILSAPLLFLVCHIGMFIIAKIKGRLPPFHIGSKVLWMISLGLWVVFLSAFWAEVSAVSLFGPFALFSVLPLIGTAVYEVFRYQFIG